jgi:hypothetical protein
LSAVASTEAVSLTTVCYGSAYIPSGRITEWLTGQNGHSHRREIGHDYVVPTLQLVTNFGQDLATKAGPSKLNLHAKFLDSDMEYSMSSDN